MKFYFARHGQTDANKQRILQGCGIDTVLNSEGTSQAVALACKMNVPDIENIYVSSLKRARQTADILVKDLKVKVPIHVSEDLREWRLGDWEGQPSDLYLGSFLGNGEPPNGESRKEFYTRVEKGLTLALNSARPFLMVAHGGVWMVIQDVLKLSRFKIANCQIAEVTLIDGVWHQRLIE